MNTAQLVVDADSLQVHTGARAGVFTATGDIHVVLGNMAFPTPGWNDFVVVVLEWWGAAIVRLLRSSAEQELVDFMEGPYAVELTVPLPGILRLRAVQGPSRDEEKAVAETPVDAFARNVLESCERVLDACVNRNHQNRDVERLRNTFLALTSEYTSLTQGRP